MQYESKSSKYFHLLLFVACLSQLYVAGKPNLFEITHISEPLKYGIKILMPVSFLLILIAPKLVSPSRISRILLFLSNLNLLIVSLIRYTPYKTFHYFCQSFSIMESISLISSPEGTNSKSLDSMTPFILLSFADSLA